MTKRVGIASDHGGYPLKVELVPWLQAEGYDVVDLGAHELDPLDDYGQHGFGLLVVDLNRPRVSVASPSELQRQLTDVDFR